MYKLIIVDDEYSVRAILSEYVKNSGLGFEVMGMFSNGERALNYIAENPVDVVLADIRMPKMDGLELARIVSEKYRKCRVTLISGYSEFDYAKRAIRYGVINYLVKPINVRELYDTLSQTITMLDTEKLHELENNNLLNEKREQFFADFLMGGFNNEDEICRAFQSLAFQFSLEKISLTLICMNLTSELSNEAKEMIEASAPKMLQIVSDALWTCSVSDAELGWVFVVITPRAITFSADKASEIFRNWLSSSQFSLTKVFYEDLRVMPKSYISKSLRNSLSLSLSHLLSGDHDGAYAILHNLVKEIWQHSSITESELQKKVQETFRMFCDVYDESGQATTSGMDIGSTLAGMAEIVKTSSQHEDAVIRKAKEFIDKNYHHNLNRDGVAEYVFMNSSYFSRYFKQKTDESFYDYLNRFRIQKAIGLLDTNMKISEIGESVGYNNMKYFRRHFKQYTSYTPYEYRQKVFRIDRPEDSEDE